MTLELWIKVTGAGVYKAPIRYQDSNDAVCVDERMGKYWLLDGNRLLFVNVPVERVEYVAVRMPFLYEIPTYAYIPERLGLKYHCSPAGVAWQHKPLTFPGTAHAPLLATCGPEGGLLLGCLDHTRTVELFASQDGLELRFRRPVAGTVARLAAWSFPTMTADVSLGLDAFLAAWGGPSEPSKFLEHRPLILDLNSQDVPDDKLVTVCNQLIANHSGLANTCIVWGAQDDPDRKCCKAIITWREVAAYVIEELQDADWNVLPYTRPDGADFGEWLSHHHSFGCDDVYIDHVPGSTTQQIQGVIGSLAGPASIIEWPTLALPSFGVLASGCIHGNAECQTWPDMTPRPRNPNLSTWPEMGRRLFPRTKMFAGTQNGLDASWWGQPDGTATGEPKRFAHATERWAFRLGMGLIPRPTGWEQWQIDHPGEFCPQWSLNACTDAIMGEWYRTRFWHRKPRWVGVVDRNPKNFVTEFEVEGGKLHCIDQWDNPDFPENVGIMEVA